MKRPMATNIAKCKSCGDVIESKHRHDFQACKCGDIFIDGGKDYIRFGWPGDKSPDECIEFIEKNIEEDK